MTSPAISRSRPVPVAVSEVLPWLVGAVLFGLALYYVVGIEQGATALFGNNMVVHELLHDARHLLGFPCH
jgi:cobalt transporter subunit CbtB